MELLWHAERSRLSPVQPYLDIAIATAFVFARLRLDPHANARSAPGCLSWSSTTQAPCRKGMIRPLSKSS